MSDVFISYAREDAAQAQRLQRALMNLGLTVFVDQDVLVAGTDFSRAIEDSLRSAKAVVVLLSSNTRRGKWVQEELIAVLEAKDGALVIPVLLDGQAKDNWVWPLVANRQAIDLTQQPHDIEEVATRVRRAIAGSAEDILPPQQPPEALANTGRATPLKKRNYMAVGGLLALLVGAAIVTSNLRTTNQREEIDRRVVAELEQARVEEAAARRKREQEEAAARIRRQTEAERALSEGLRLVGQGKLSDGISFYEQSIQLNPESAVAHEYLGYAKLRRAQINRDAQPDDVQIAIQAFERAASLDPKYVWAPYNLALAYWQAGRKDEAVTQVKRVLELDPSFASVISKDRQFIKFRQSPAFRELLSR